MALPVVHALARYCRVSWLIRRGNAPLLKLFPQLDCEAWPVDFLPNGEYSARTRDELAAAQFDALVDFSNWDNTLRLARRLPSIPIRAVAYDDRRWLVRQRWRALSPWRRPFNRIVRLNGRLHRVEKWRRLLEIALEIRLSIEWPLRDLAEPAAPHRIFVHPHASKGRKRWPVDRFVTLLQSASRRMHLECQINEGTPQERHVAMTLQDHLRSSGIDATCVPLDPTFIALRDALVRADVAIGPDSGPLQLASILGTPTIVVYGPTDPGEVAPRYRSISVTPPNGRSSMSDVTPEAVLAALDEHLSHRGRLLRAAHAPRSTRHQGGRD